MGTIYVPAALLRADWVACRDAIFQKLMDSGYDFSSALMHARQQADWEFRHWRTHEEREACDTQKDFDDMRQGDWTK